MKNSKKILSIALTLAMLMSAIFCTGAVATAEGETTPTASVVVLTHSTTEADMDWEQDAFGPNLIPDSTVAEWTQDAETQKWTYNKYYASNGSTVENPNAWWGSESLSNTGYEGPGVRGYVTKEDSHTADGSGSLFRKLNGWWYIPLKQMGAAYYVITFWAKAGTASSFNFQVMTNYGGAIGSEVYPELTTEWQRFTILTYAAVDRNQVGKFFKIGNWESVDLYIDEIEQYKVTTEYAQACIEAGNKLLNGKESYTSSDTGKTTAVTVSADYNFASLGANLVNDPTVNQFDGTTYKDYNATAAPNANFALPFVSGASGAMYNSAKKNGYTVLDTANSHTADGSGVIKITTSGEGSRTIALSSQKADAHSYYLVSFWTKSVKGYISPMRFYIGKSNSWQYNEYNMGSVSSGSGWTHRNFIIYTGNCKFSSGEALNRFAVGGHFGADSEIYFDDFALYKLDAKYAHYCKSSGKLLTEGQYAALLREEDTNISSTSTTLKIPATYTAYTPINTENLGTNLCTDSTVADWNGDTYNTSGWWTKKAFNNTDTLYDSMYSRGFLTKDTSYSHTKDGSGAIVLPEGPNTVYLPLTLPNLRSYYLVTAWIKDIDKGIQTGPYTEGSPLVIKAGEAFNGWRQIAWIIYQGDKISGVNFCVYQEQKQEVVIDEFCIYELDYEFGKKCMDAKAWATGASSKDDVTFKANATQTITATDGYFIPYGAVQTADGKIAEKLGNGQFYATTAGNYSCAEFKYPTGTVGTFGASAKTTGTTGIQFGSLITDNLNVEANGTGTLVFRGDFDAFRKTFPTKTRAEVANIIYNALNNANIPHGEAVTLKNGGKSVVVMNVPRKTYMWKNSANTELQYAVRVTNVVGNDYADVDFTAIGYVTKGGKLEFSNEIKTANYNELIPAQN